MAAGVNRAKTDLNQNELIEVYKKAGADVFSLAGVGDGCPDLLVAYHGKWGVAEVKDGRKPPSQRKLTSKEAAWHERFSVHAPVWVVKDDDDVLEMLRSMDDD